LIKLSIGFGTYLNSALEGLSLYWVAYMELFLLAVGINDKKKITTCFMYLNLMLILYCVSRFWTWLVFLDWLLCMRKNNSYGNIGRKDIWYIGRKDGEEPWHGSW
jgi:hypothetical protein